MKNNSQQILEHLEKIRDSGILVIVEGKNDRKALAEFGITNVMVLYGKALFEVVEEVEARTKECIILTDLDKKGKQLYGKLNSKLGQMGVKIDNKFRHFLFRKTKLRQIEGLATYVNKLGEKNLQK